MILRSRKAKDTLLIVLLILLVGIAWVGAFEIFAVHSDTATESENIEK